MLRGKTIILGVTGGIAAYKSADLVSRLRKQNANVEVIMTEAAAKFVTPLTFQTMSNNPVHKDMFKEIDKFDVEHIELAKKADIIVVAPATANTIGKVANGLADNLLTTVLMASRSKVAFAPAMNTEMYNNSFYKENVNKLKSIGYEFIEPGTGRLACGDVGAGKMAEPEDIVEYIIGTFKDKDLLDNKVIVTAGPTIEEIDPVRYISNHSSGKMGYSIAKEARDRGADVVLITGPSCLKKPKGVEIVEIKSTKEMFEKVGKYFDEADIVIKAAAPGDFRPLKFENKKIKKRNQNKGSMKIELTENPDIAKYYGEKKKKQILIGFAAETNNIIENAKQKVKSKNFDFIVANDVSRKDSGFKSDTNIISIIDDTNNIDKYPLMNKTEVATIILDKAVEKLKNKS